MLDIFAGTGNLGIEALSRGAKNAVFIDNSRESTTIIAKNLSCTGFTDRSRVILKDFFQALVMLESAGAVFQLIFFDPPYQKGLTERCLEQLGKSSVIDEQSVIVAEFSSREDIAECHGSLRQIDKRVYGDTAVAFFTTTQKGST